jgi:hypothetical protein
MIGMLQKLGGLINVLGVPGIVRDADYKSQRLGTRVQVRRGKLFTVVSVNGINVYFDRLTGSIDSVGLAQPTARMPALPVPSQSHDRSDYHCQSALVQNQRRLLPHA